jgi:prepilin-type N-terminal cleavage/methylation domain-containing protein/prepilin-type processing-associated H-X9-DG protein
MGMTFSGEGGRNSTGLPANAKTGVIDNMLMRTKVGQSRIESVGSAFTLVELLVVMAIIAILAALLLPALSRAKGQGKGAVCRSNQRQIAMAAFAYTADNTDWMNPLQTAVPNSAVETTYRVILWDYVGHMASIYDCPAETVAVYADGISANDALYGDFALTPGTDWSQVGIGVAGPYVAAAGGDYEKWNQSGIGVAGAHWIHVDGNPDPTAQVSSMPFGRPIDEGYYEGMKKYTDVTTPSKLIWYGDGGCGSPTTWADDSWWIKHTDTSGNGSEDQPGFNRLLQDQYGCQRHDGDANYAFADGHVDRLNANDIRCDAVECWWSVQINFHTGGQLALNGAP